MPEAQERLLGDILSFCIVLEHPARDRENREPALGALRELCRERDLIVTGSSDYHGLGKPNLPGEYTTADDMVARIVARATGSAPVHP